MVDIIMSTVLMICIFVFDLDREEQRVYLQLMIFAGGVVPGVLALLLFLEWLGGRWNEKKREESERRRREKMVEDMVRYHER